MKANLLTFLSTGKLGEIGLGTPIDSVKKLLGKPERHEKMTEPQKAEILHYGAFFANFGGKLNLYAMKLQFDDYSGPLPAKLQLEGPSLSAKTPCEEIEKILKSAEIQYEADVQDYGNTYKTAAGVEVRTIQDMESGKKLLTAIDISDFAWMWK
jgi:hypothetical protein